MKHLTIIVLAILCPVFGSTLNIKPNFTSFEHGRIVGGEDTTIEEHPFQVSLHFFHVHICGGSILSQRWVLSAAHCTTLSLGFSHTPIRGLSVRIGTHLFESGGQEIAVLKVYDHASYLVSAPVGLDYDITLIYLERDITFSTTVQPISLPEANQIYPPGTNATVTGWGLTDQWASAFPEVLQKAIVPILNNEVCENMYNIWFLFGLITDRMICAGYELGQIDACGGDSGGPLVISGTLVGVVSWGYGCAYEMAPGVYSNVANLRTWIQEIAGI